MGIISRSRHHVPFRRLGFLPFPSLLLRSSLLLTSASPFFDWDAAGAAGLEERSLSVVTDSQPTTIHSPFGRSVGRSEGQSPLPHSLFTRHPASPQQQQQQQQHGSHRSSPILCQQPRSRCGRTTGRAPSAQKEVLHRDKCALY
jgi:hypothetical protein